MPENPSLVSSLSSIRHQEKLMKENLSEGKLMLALKNCLNFLSELRSLAFSPKEYYELYMAVFDALDAFSAYLVQSNKSKQAKNKDALFLTDLYELVQYLGHIVPRLYLMIVVGTTCMALHNGSTKDIMKDMMEMCRGVQHPVRGLFLRHYLCQRLKGLFPMANMADFNDTVNFLVTNFVEMNKLWVRLQHQGHSSERALRYQERKELKILVGSNLVRLSQVVDDLESDGYSAVGYYETKLFPIITEQIIQCKDHLAQSYLIDVVIQVFPDEFHFATLQKLLNDVFLQLHPMLPRSGLVSALVDRFANFRKAEADRIATEIADLSMEESPQESTEKSTQKSQKSTQNFPVDLVFTPFWEFYANLRSLDPPLPLQEVVPILQSLVKLVLAFEPKNVLNLDKIYEFAAVDLKGEASVQGESEEDMQKLWMDLLMTPVEHFPSIKRLLDLPFFHTMYLKITNPQLQKQLSCDIAEKLLASSLEYSQSLSSPEEIDGVFKYLQVLVEEAGIELNTTKSLGVEPTIKLDGGEKLVTQAFLHVQETVCKVLHLIGNADEFKCLSNLFYVKKKYLGKCPQNIVHLYPTLVTKMTNTLRIAGYKNLRAQKEMDSDFASMITSNFKNVSVVIDELYLYHQQFNAELVLKLYLNLASVADQFRQENIAYELFSQCFVVYEENLVLQASQCHILINPHESMDGSVAYQSVVMIANRLASLRYFSKVNYEALITKVTLYGSKLLKKQDQCRSIYQCAHLWWWCDILIEGTSPTVERPRKEGKEGKEGTEHEKKDSETAKNMENVAIESVDDKEPGPASKDPPAVETLVLYRDAKRVFECLQKALRVADSCMDPYLLLKLFVEILNRCLIFHIYDNWMVDARYISGLIDLISTNLANFEDQHLSGVEDDQEARLLKRIEVFFERTLEYLRDQQKSSERLREISV